jgi:hypothetical protein
MKNINKLKPKTFVFDHELAKHLSKPLRDIIKGHNEDYWYSDKTAYPFDALVKTADWSRYLEEYIEECVVLDDNVTKEYKVQVTNEFKALRKYLTHEAEFDYIFISIND